MEKEETSRRETTKSKWLLFMSVVGSWNRGVRVLAVLTPSRQSGPALPTCQKRMNLHVVVLFLAGFQAFQSATLAQRPRGNNIPTLYHASNRRGPWELEARISDPGQSVTFIVLVKVGTVSVHREPRATYYTPPPPRPRSFHSPADAVKKLMTSCLC
jgi:hypothetical protein